MAPSWFMKAMTCQTLCMCSPGACKITTVSSSYICTNSRLNFLGRTSLALRNVLRVPFNINRMRVKRKGLWGDMNAVLFRSSSEISSCQYRPFTFSIKNIFSSPRKLMCLSMPGIGYKSQIVTASNFRSLTKMQGLPSFLGTNTICYAHLVWASLKTSITIIWSVSVSSNSFAFQAARNGYIGGALLRGYPDFWFYFQLWVHGFDRIKVLSHLLLDFMLILINVWQCAD